MKNTEKTMDPIVALCKGRGFVYPGSEIYGGLANSWDYGPLGVELKNNVKRAWWKKFVQEIPLQRGPGRRHPHEPRGVGGLRPCVHLQRSPHRLQGLQDAPPGRQAHRGLVRPRMAATT